MSLAFSLLFVAFLLLMVALKYWLAARQIRHVAAHADAVPAQFAERVSLEAHRKAAAYTIAKQRFGLIETAVGTALLVALTLLGGLQAIADALAALLGRGFLLQVGVVAAVVALVSLVDIPFSWYRQFRIEQAFGFNRMTLRVFFSDLAKSALLAALLGLPVLAVVLWLMERAGDLWWLYAWGVWIAFNALVLVLYPTVIAPLFNKFEPLADAALADRIARLLARTGFSSKGVFVMDGSRRSSHGNAYFTGLGRNKRIVFFDTLVERLQPQEIEAVLAHELGHFKLKHIRKRLALSALASLGFLALLGWLADQTWFYQGLGVQPALDARNDGLALVLFILVAPVFTFVLAPLVSALSRAHEFEADAFAARNSSAHDLVSALVKLYQDNAATLTPDPLHSAFYDSHPPAAIRIERLLAQPVPATAAA
ncbi:M48 family metallopeptidase [Betaproteobacteria bacterium PRO7]|nr:M48 family metallopeptidase [Betaproteobacteria bacterium PRO7]